MALNLNNFMLSLAKVMASLSSTALNSSLWVHQAVEAQAAQVYGVLRMYPGPDPRELDFVPQASIQCMVSGKVESAALALAQKLYESLYDNNVPRNTWILPGQVMTDAGIAPDATQDWHVRGVVLHGPPGSIGRDERGVVQVFFNFDVEFEPQAKEI